jgi:hypothetical protein
VAESGRETLNRIVAFTDDKVFLSAGAVGLCLYIAKTFVQVPYVSFVLSVLLLVVQVRLVFYRLWWMAAGILFLFAGACLSTYYELTGTKRPPRDEYTGLLCLTGLVIILCHLLLLNQAARKADAAHR